MTPLRRLAAWALQRADPERRLVASGFDRAWYLEVNPDVARSRMDPLDHFLAHGWREGRDPNPDFSLREYLNNNPDVARAGGNPFVHYLKVGRAEGREATHDLGFRYRIVARQVPVEGELARAAAAGPHTADAPAALADALAGTGDLHVTFSQDDYLANVGGIQLCLQREGTAVAALGRRHLHLFPPTHWPMLRAGEPGLLCAMLDGRRLGTFAPAEIARILRGRAGAHSFAIHSLLGHAVSETAEIAEAAGASAGYYWLHDWTSLCAGHHLLRNGVEDCAAPPPDSAACGICIHGAWRGRHLSGHETLFRRLPLTVVAPAQVTLEFWRASWDFPVADAVVHPHARLAPRTPAARPPGDRPLRVAFLGYPAPHKGWPQFRDIAIRHLDDPRYAFLHLGARREPAPGVEFHDVRVGPEDPRAMQAALEAMEVDVVLFWPLWRETFSFATYEAIAAGCAVVTGPDSGNVAATVEAGGHGWVLPDAAALAAAFAEGRVSGLSRAARAPMLYDLHLSGMTADLIPARAPA